MVCSTRVPDSQGWQADSFASPHVANDAKRVKKPDDVMGRAGMDSWVGTHVGRTERVHVNKK